MSAHMPCKVAAHAGLHVFATASSQDVDHVRKLGAGTVVDHRSQRFEDLVPNVEYRGWRNERTIVRTLEARWNPRLRRAGLDAPQRAHRLLSGRSEQKRLDAL